MSEMKFVNLDELATPISKTIRWKKVDHEVRELTVGSFKQAMDLQAKLEGMDEETPEEDVIETYIEMIALTIPTIPVDEVRLWNLTQMTAVVGLLVAQSVEDLSEDEDLGKEPAETTTE